LLYCNIATDVAAGEDDSDLLTLLDDVTSGWYQDDSYEGSQSSPTSLLAGTSDYLPSDDVFSPVTSTCGNFSSFSTLSPGVVQCEPAIPIPPDIAPLLRGSRASTEEYTVSRVPTPPDITPLLKGALSSANIQLPLASGQPTSVSTI